MLVRSVGILRHARVRICRRATGRFSDRADQIGCLAQQLGDGRPILKAVKSAVYNHLVCPAFVGALRTSWGVRNPRKDTKWFHRDAR